MQIIDTFGAYVERLSSERPVAARTLLKTGWRLQNAKFHLLPDRRLSSADRYLASLMMDTMLRPLTHPGQCAIVSVFTPCELLQEAGLSPYNVEGFSCYLSASHAEGALLRRTEEDGLSETLCSYHKTFLGAAKQNLLPKPNCIVYTSIACDANLLTFRSLAEHYGTPSFFLDVPSQATPENIARLAEQFRALAAFLTETTGKRIDEARLAKRLYRSRRTLDNYAAARRLRADRHIPADLVSPLYCGMTNNLLLGTEAEERYTRLLLNDIRHAPPSRGARIYWMHTIPFWSEALKEALRFNDRALIVGDELADVCMPAQAGYDAGEAREAAGEPGFAPAQSRDAAAQSYFDPEQPYEAMAARLICNTMNGPALRRIEAGIRNAREVGADGVVWFNHWGCKHTLGASQLAKKKFEEAGIPLLLLDGDGCDRSRGGEGQTATRLGAFLEMLGA